MASCIFKWKTNWKRTRSRAATASSELVFAVVLMTCLDKHEFILKIIPEIIVILVSLLLMEDEK